jgi:hypothetical protein
MPLKETPKTGDKSKAFEQIEQVHDRHTGHPDCREGSRMKIEGHPINTVVGL